MRNLTYLLLVIVLLSSCSRKHNDEDPMTRFKSGNCNIGVLLGSVSDNYVTDSIPNANILRIETYVDQLTALETGQIDFVVIDDSYLPIMQSKIENLKVLIPKLAPMGFAVGFPKDQQELCNTFNEFLQQIENNGVYKEMQDRWLNNKDADKAVMPVLELPTQGEIFKVGTFADGFPYDFIRDGEIIGFDVELMKRFAIYINRPIEISNINFGALIPALSSGRINAIASVMAVTKDRANNVLFSKPYSYGYVAVVYKAKEGSNNQQIPLSKDDSIKMLLNGGKKMAIVVGTAQDGYLSKILPIESIYYVNNQSELPLAVTTDKAQYFVSNYALAKTIHKKEPDINEVMRNILPADVAMGFNLEDHQLRNQFNDFLLNLKSTGELKRIHDKWLTELDDAEMQPIDFSNATSILKVATNMNAPYSISSNNSLKGLDIELVSLFAHSIGKRPEFQIMEFASFIPAITAKRVDMLASGLMITDERKKNIAFSEPYEKSYTCVMTLSNNQDTSIAHNKDSFFTTVKQQFHNNLIAEQRYKMIFDGLYATVIISIFALLLGTIFGSIVCWMRMSSNLILKGFAKLYINIVRGTPVLVLLMILFYVVFARTVLSGITIAIITFALNFGAYVSEMFRTSIQSIDRGQTEAGIAMGFSKIQTFILIIAPQAVRRVLPVYKGEAISLIKMTSIVGYVAVMDLTKASDIIRSRTFDAFFPLILIALIYFILAWILGLLLDYFNQKMTKR